MHKKIFNKRVEAVREHERELIEKYGWLVHYVFETNQGEFNGLSNIHTHGLAENFGHPDIQVVLPIAQNTIHPVLVGIVEDIKNGKKFEPNQRSSEVLRGMDVYFARFKEGNRTVLRMILPDPNGKLPFEEGCEEIYARQMEVLPEV